MVYQIITNEDAFWLKELLGGIPQEGSPTSGNGVLEGMLIPFRSAVRGMIIYDPNFVDSINIATTMAGQNDCIVVSPDQAADLQQPYNLPVHTDLRNQHWSNRSQAYDWARQNLLSGASSHAVAGLNPITAGLRAFLVANRIFVYWLDSSSAEQSLMAQIYKAFPPEAVHLGWFIDEPSGVKLTFECRVACASYRFIHQPGSLDRCAGYNLDSSVESRWASRTNRFFQGLCFFYYKRW